MPIEIAKCPACDGQINIDTDREKMYCMYCGNPFIVSDIINNHITNITNNYNVQNAVLQHDTEVEQIIKNAHIAVDRFLNEMHMKNSFAELNSVMNDLRRIETRALDNADYWWACIDVITKRFCHFDTIDDFNAAIKYYNRIVDLEGMTWERAEQFYIFLVCVKEKAAYLADFYDKSKSDYSMISRALYKYIDYLEINKLYEDINGIEEYKKWIEEAERETANKLATPYDQLLRFTIENNIKLYISNKGEGNLSFKYSIYSRH